MHLTPEEWGEEGGEEQEEKIVQLRVFTGFPEVFYGETSTNQAGEWSAWSGPLSQSETMLCSLLRGERSLSRRDGALATSETRILQPCTLILTEVPRL